MGHLESMTECMTFAHWGRGHDVLISPSPGGRIWDLGPISVPGTWPYMPALEALERFGHGPARDRLLDRGRLAEDGGIWWLTADRVG